MEFKLFLKNPEVLLADDGIPNGRIRGINFEECFCDAELEQEASKKLSELIVKSCEDCVSGKTTEADLTEALYYNVPFFVFREQTWEQLKRFLEIESISFPDLSTVLAQAEYIPIQKYDKKDIPEIANILIDAYYDLLCYITAEDIRGDEHYFVFEAETSRNKYLVGGKKAFLEDREYFVNNDPFIVRTYYKPIDQEIEYASNRLGTLQNDNGLMVITIYHRTRDNDLEEVCQISKEINDSKGEVIYGCSIMGELHTVINPTPEEKDALLNDVTEAKIIDDLYSLIFSKTLFRPIDNYTRNRRKPPEEDAMIESSPSSVQTSSRKWEDLNYLYEAYSDKETIDLEDYFGEIRNPKPTFKM